MAAAKVASRRVGLTGIPVVDKLALNEGPGRTATSVAVMSVAGHIRRKLEAKFSPLHLDVVDESHLHAGHAGARPGGESHFRVELVSAAFQNQSRLARQRMVYEALADEIAGPVHALSLRLFAPDEAAGRPE